MIKNINVRFFTYCFEDNEPDICEITEAQFIQLKGKITYERHSVFDNGCRQICLTVEPAGYPDSNELERV
jgi:hypothetical protein